MNGRSPDGLRGGSKADEMRPNAAVSEPGAEVSGNLDGIEASYAGEPLYAIDRERLADLAPVVILTQHQRTH